VRPAASEDRQRASPRTGLSLGERHAGSEERPATKGPPGTWWQQGRWPQRPRRRSQSLTTPDAEDPGSRSACASVLPGVIPWAARPPVRRPGTLRPCRCLSLRAYPERQALGRRSVTSPLSVWISHQMLRTPLRASLALAFEPYRFRLNESLRLRLDRVKRFCEIHRKFTGLLTFPPTIPRSIPESSTRSLSDFVVIRLIWTVSSRWPGTRDRHCYCKEELADDPPPHDASGRR